MNQQRQGRGSPTEQDDSVKQGVHPDRCHQLPQGLGTPKAFASLHRPLERASFRLAPPPSSVVLQVARGETVPWPTARSNDSLSQALLSSRFQRRAPEREAR